MSYICETCGLETAIVFDENEPISQCCDDYVMDGSRRLTYLDYQEHCEANEADDRNDRERENR